ncbi:hypothetical protein [Photobacterium sp. R1]
MKFIVPSLAEQQRVIVEKGTQEAIKKLNENLFAPVLPPQKEVNESDYSRAHLLDNRRYQSPHPDIIGAYFRHFQAHFPEYKADESLAKLLGVSSGRRIREWKQGKYKVPYEIWDRFLVMTGRKPQDVIKVFAFMGQ